MCVWVCVCVDGTMKEERKNNNWNIKCKHTSWYIFYDVTFKKKENTKNKKE